jgi:hypothetical protein
LCSARDFTGEANAIVGILDPDWRAARADRLQTSLNLA